MSDKMKLQNGSGIGPGNGGVMGDKSGHKNTTSDSIWRKGRKGIVWKGRVIIPKKHPVGAKAL